MNELSAVNLTELKSQDLKKDLSVMIKSINGIRKQTWQYALAIENIIAHESFKDDFRNLDEFAKYINLSKTTISQYCNAVKGKEMLDKSAMFARSKWDIDKISIGKAYICSIFDKAELESFLEYLMEHDISLPDCSDKTLRNGYRAYKESMIEENENEEDHTENEVQENPKEADQTVETHTEKGKPHIKAQVLDIAVEDDCMKDVRIAFEIHLPDGKILNVQEILHLNMLQRYSEDHKDLVRELSNDGFIEIAP